MAKFYKFAICDDDEEFAQAINEKIGQYFSTSQNNVIIEKFNNAESLLETNLNFDFLFLDIEMPGMTGIEAKDIIQLKNKNISIIFVTNYQQYMKEAFGKNVVDYINKDQLNEISKILKKIESDDATYNIINLAGDMIDTRNILYLEAKGSATIVVTTHKDSQLYSIYLNELQSRIHNEIFVRCHKSFVVNLKYIKSIRYNYIVLCDFKEIPLSRKYHDSFKTLYREYLRGGASL